MIHHVPQTYFIFTFFFYAFCDLIRESLGGGGESKALSRLDDVMGRVMIG